MNFDRLLNEALENMDVEDIIRNVSNILIKDGRPVDPLKLKNTISKVLDPNADDNDNATPYFTDKDVISRFAQILKQSGIRLVDWPTI
jgi:hypothetical protein